MDARKAAAEIVQLTSKFKGLIALGEYLEESGRIEHMAEEFKAVATKAEADAKNAQQELNLALTAKADAVRETAAIIAGAEAEHKRVIERAQGDRAQIIDEAKAQAAQIREEAESLLAAANEACEQRAIAAGALDAEIATKHKELERIHAALAEARAKLGV